MNLSFVLFTTVLVSVCLCGVITPARQASSRLVFLSETFPRALSSSHDLFPLLAKATGVSDHGNHELSRDISVLSNVLFVVPGDNGDIGMTAKPSFDIHTTENWTQSVISRIEAFATGKASYGGQLVPFFTEELFAVYSQRSFVFSLSSSAELASFFRSTANSRTSVGLNMKTGALSVPRLPQNRAEIVRAIVAAIPGAEAVGATATAVRINGEVFDTQHDADLKLLAEIAGALAFPAAYADKSFARDSIPDAITFVFAGLMEVRKNAMGPLDKHYVAARDLVLQTITRTYADIAQKMYGGSAGVLGEIFFAGECNKIALAELGVTRTATEQYLRDTMGSMPINTERFPTVTFQSRGECAAAASSFSLHQSRLVCTESRQHIRPAGTITALQESAGNNTNNGTVVPPPSNPSSDGIVWPTMSQTADNQIFWWTIIILVVILYMTLYIICNIHNEDDPILYGKKLE